MKSIKHIAALSAVLGLAGCVADTELESTLNETSFEEFEQTVYQEPSGAYVVNGDELIETRDELYQFYLRLFSDGALIVHQSGGADACWEGAARLAITYCVSQASFGGNYGRVVSAMADAAGAWEAVADVDFVHDSSKDGNCNQRTKGVVFDVRQVQSGQYLARAFFPGDSRRNSNVLIDTSTYVYDDDPSDPLSLRGVLRHELGHVLGFRHEHTRPESGTCFEDNNWRELTSYDASSVMHYPQCNGDGDWSLTLTTKDAQGAADLYGQPGVGGGSCGGGGGGGECLPAGDPCGGNSDCCSNNCKGGRGGKSCR